jgi:hypothetical protein
MTITTGMNPAMAAAQADHIADYQDAADMSVSLFFSTRDTWEDPDASVGFAGGLDITVTMIGAQIGQLVLSQADAALALEGLVAWMERAESERLTEGADHDDAPRMPSRMEAAE